MSQISTPVKDQLQCSQQSTDTLDDQMSQKERAESLRKFFNKDIHPPQRFKKGVATKEQIKGTICSKNARQIIKLANEVRSAKQNIRMSIKDIDDLRKDLLEQRKNTDKAIWKTKSSIKQLSNYSSEVYQMEEEATRLLIECKEFTKLIREIKRRQQSPLKQPPPLKREDAKVWDEERFNKQRICCSGCSVNEHGSVIPHMEQLNNIA